MEVDLTGDKQRKVFYDTTVIRSRRDIEVIRNTWLKLQWHPDGDVDRYVNMLENRKEILQPYIIVSSECDEIKNIVAGRLESGTWNYKFGYYAFFKSNVKFMAVGYGAIIGDDSEENAKTLVRELKKVVASKTADIIFLQHLRKDSNFYKYIFEQFRSSGNLLMMEPTTHRMLLLPETYEDFLLSISKNVRKNMRNYRNRLQKKYGNTISIKCYQKPSDLDTLLQDLEAIASKTYHRGLCVGFVANDATRERIRLDLRNGNHRSYILYIDLTPAAFWSGVKYADIFYMGITGFLPEYREDHLGISLLYKCIEDFCSDKSIRKIDFGLGDSEYKKILCNESIEEVSIFLASDTKKGIAVRLIGKSVMKAESASRKMLRKFNLENRIKNMWRKKLAQ
jgi:hypothetical protein